MSVNTTRPSDIRRILTIDDNDAIHGDFRKILTASDAAGAPKLASAKSLLFGTRSTPLPTRPTFEVDSALQGQEGLSRLQAALAEGRPYSVAFVDMRMPPGWDGLQTIQALWEVDPDIQVVICSAYTDYSWDEISEKLGLSDRLLILKKPFDPAEITQLATALSEKWLLRREAKLKMHELEAMVRERTVELTQLALYDKLTGLGNRALFTERLTRSVERASKEDAYEFAVLFFDFDRFKVVNDSLGHEAGDRVLQGIAQRLTAALKLAGPVLGDALACRLGGDEFTVLIDGPTVGFDPHRFAADLIKILAAPYQIGDRAAFCTASIGITTSALKYTSAADALRDADTAMYHAKAAGKARYVFFDRKMHEEMIARLELEDDLRHAIERDEIEVYYQPIISLTTGRVHGFEALARWRHPTRGLIPPLEFIPCCEEIGLIDAMGICVLTKACAQLRTWRDRFDAELTMSVNLAARQVAAPDLLQRIDAVLRAAGLEPSALHLEITESAMMSDPASAIATFKAIRAHGIGLHLDDFGTGYSSLSALHQFPINGVKIDRSFVKSLTERRDYAAVVHAIVNLARHLGLRVIVEGIETAEQVILLQAMDCDFAQGYHFGRPMPAADATAFLARPTVPHALAA